MKHPVDPVEINSSFASRFCATPSYYVLEAKYKRWKRVLKKDLNVVKEIATSKLKLVPFNFKKAAKLASAAQAAIRLVDLAGEVSDKFPDELEPEAFRTFKDFLQVLLATALSQNLL
jgi:endonuclease III